MKSTRILHRKFISLIAPLCFVVTAQTEARADAIFNNDATQSPDASFYARGRWEFGWESTYSFVVIPNPFFAMAGAYNKNRLDYELNTEIFSLRYQLTNPAGPWFLRGNWEISALLLGSVIIDGPESYFAGLGAGLRYYFVQPRARLVPFIEVRGGAGFTDSRGYRDAQQQDFTFVTCSEPACVTT